MKIRNKARPNSLYWVPISRKTSARKMTLNPIRVTPKGFIGSKSHYGKPAHLFRDSDRDGVPNVFDCKPHNKRRQDVMHPQNLGGSPLGAMYARQEQGRQIRDYNRQLAEYQRLEEERLKELRRLETPVSTPGRSSTRTIIVPGTSIWSSTDSSGNTTTTAKPQGIDEPIKWTQSTTTSQTKTTLPTNTTTVRKDIGTIKTPTVIVKQPSAASIIGGVITKTIKNIFVPKIFRK